MTARRRIQQTSLAGARFELGDLHGARSLHDQVLAIRRRVFCDDHPDTLTSMNNLAEVLYTLGDLGGAEHLHKLTVTGRERVLGGIIPTL
jgi:hypothetical protein